MKNESGMLNGTCKYCGQSQMVIADTEEKANEIAEAACSCKEGQPARRIKAARDKVDAKFEEFSEETVDLIQDCISAVNYGTIKSATINLNSTTKVSLAMTGNGEKISVTRTDTEVDKEEI